MFMNPDIKMKQQNIIYIYIYHFIFIVIHLYTDARIKICFKISWRASFKLYIRNTEHSKETYTYSIIVLFALDIYAYFEWGKSACLLPSWKISTELI